MRGRDWARWIHVNDAPLWAVTCLFNPARYALRARNYRQFRARLGVPLVAVELAFDGRFELEAADADVLVRVRDGDVMWQKERLLNIGLRHLPAPCRAVAIVDADVVFRDDGWPAAAEQALATAPVVQLFREVALLPRDGTPENGARAREVARYPSLAWAIGERRDPRDVLAALGAHGRPDYARGLAWGFRRDLLDRHGLFDGCIIGGGDTAMCGATLGVLDAVEAAHAMNPHQRRYYRAWAERWYADVRGRMGCLPGEILHLWHGEMKHRQAATRHPTLAAHDYDPSRDLVAGAEGAWRWASDKPALHRRLVDYFAGRREDG